MLGAQAYAADLSGLHGLDNRHASWRVQSTAQELFAEAVSADRCWFSTDGTPATCTPRSRLSLDPVARSRWRAIAIFP
jgi:arginine/lysine/ornithine decarboxylase